MNRKNLTILIFAIIVLLGTIFFVVEKKKVVKEQERQVEVKKEEERKIAEQKEKEEKETEQRRIEEEKKQESADSDLDKLEWKKYENKEVGFEISYPSSHFLSTSWKAGNKNLVVAIRNTRIAKGIEAIKDVPAIESGYIEISTWKNKENLDLFEWFKKNDPNYIRKSEESKNKNFKIKKDIFKGYEVLRVDEELIMDNERIYFKIKDNVVCFDSQGVSLDQDLQQDNGEKNYFAKIMATLKITK